MVVICGKEEAGDGDWREGRKRKLQSGYNTQEKKKKNCLNYTQVTWEIRPEMRSET